MHGLDVLLAVFFPEKRRNSTSRASASSPPALPKPPHTFWTRHIRRKYSYLCTNNPSAVRWVRSFTTRPHHRSSSFAAAQGGPLHHPTRPFICDCLIIEYPVHNWGRPRVARSFQGSIHQEVITYARLVVRTARSQTLVVGEAKKTYDESRRFHLTQRVCV